MTIRLYASESYRPLLVAWLTRVQTMQSINAPDVTKRDHFAFGAGRRICKYTYTIDRITKRFAH